MPEGEVQQTVVSAMDWLPTLAACCSLSLPDRVLDGKDLTSILRTASSGEIHEALHWMVDGQWAVRKGPWKLVFTAVPGEGAGAEKQKGELFLVNLHEDPGETTNFADANPVLVNELTRLHEVWLADTKRD